MADTLPNPFREEIKGIATESGVPLGKKTNVSLFFFETVVDNCDDKLATWS